LSRHGRTGFLFKDYLQTIMGGGAAATIPQAPIAIPKVNRGRRMSAAAAAAARFFYRRAAPRQKAPPWGAQQAVRRSMGAFFYCCCASTNLSAMKPSSESSLMSSQGLGSLAAIMPVIVDAYDTLR